MQLKKVCIIVFHIHAYLSSHRCTVLYLPLFILLAALHCFLELMTLAQGIFSINASSQRFLNRWVVKSPEELGKNTKTLGPSWFGKPRLLRFFSSSPGHSDTHQSWRSPAFLVVHCVTFYVRIQKHVRRHENGPETCNSSTLTAACSLRSHDTELHRYFPPTNWPAYPSNG